MAGKNHFHTHCDTDTWMEIELVDFLYNWHGEYDFYYFVNMATVKAQKLAKSVQLTLKDPTDLRSGSRSRSRSLPIEHALRGHP